MTLTPASSRGNATAIDGVTVTGTPSSGDVITATSASAAHWAAGGGSQPGAAIAHRLPFAFNTVGLATGKAIYTPTIGDVLLDMWVEISTLWDGTTPLLDIGTFDNGATGIYQYWWGAALKMDGSIYTGATYLTCLGTSSDGILSLRDLVSIGMPSAFNDALYNVVGINVNLNGGPERGNRVFPSSFVSATPLKVCVSQTGAAGGAAPGATQGSAALCIVTSTPAAT